MNYERTNSSKCINVYDYSGRRVSTSWINVLAEKKLATHRITADFNTGPLRNTIDMPAPRLYAQISVVIFYKPGTYITCTV